MSGIVTGVLLGVARISGETAPLLFTALNNQFWSADLNAPLANVPVVIFQYAMSPYDELALARLGWRAGADGFRAGAQPTRALLRADPRMKMTDCYPDAARGRRSRLRAGRSADARFDIRDLDFYYGRTHALKQVNLEVPARAVTAIIGPSGCGKSTLLRTLNRIYELYPEQRAEGRDPDRRREHPGARR